MKSTEEIFFLNEIVFFLPIVSTENGISHPTKENYNINKLDNWNPESS